MPISASTYNYYKYDNFNSKPEIEMGREKKSYNDEVTSTINKNANVKVKEKSILTHIGDFIGFNNDTKTNDNVSNDNVSNEDTTNDPNEETPLDIKINNLQKGGFTNLNLSNENLNIKNILKKNRLLHNRIQELERELYIRSERY